MGQIRNLVTEPVRLLFEIIITFLLPFRFPKLVLIFASFCSFLTGSRVYPPFCGATSSMECVTPLTEVFLSKIVSFLQKTIFFKISLFQLGWALYVKYANSRLMVFFKDKNHKKY